jgi:DNA-binding NarL/FixJ family response regulator
MMNDLQEIPMNKIIKICLPENNIHISSKIKDLLESELNAPFTMVSTDSDHEITFTPTKNDFPRTAKKLNEREIEILELMVKGLENKKIAQELFMSEQTIKNHITSIFKKLEVKNRTHAVIYAIKEPSVFEK